jgi:hypothetical protein
MTVGPFDRELERLRIAGQTPEEQARRIALADIIARAQANYFGPKRGEAPEEPPPPKPRPKSGDRRAIPTKYAGIQFRSRLEARWAAFFDLCGWGWDYEPFDLAGYCPDFLLKFHRPLIAEVKPANTREELQAHTLKIERSGWEGEILIVGSAPFDSIDWGGEHALGILDDRTFLPVDHSWGEALFSACQVCARVSIRHSECSYACRVCGSADAIGAAQPREMWCEASNRTQWRPEANR